MHPSLHSVQERRWLSPKRKSLSLEINLPKTGMWAEHKTVRELCTYKLLPTKKPNPDYHLIFGTWGPYREIYWVRFHPDPKWPDTPSWMTVEVDGKSRPVWIGLWTDLNEINRPQLTRMDLLEGREPDRYVKVPYTAPQVGNVHHTYISAKTLQEALTESNLNWHVKDYSWSTWESAVEVTIKKPLVLGRKTYRNAHEQGGNLWCAMLQHETDDWAEASDTFLGSDYPSQKAANDAIDEFLEETSTLGTTPTKTLTKPSLLLGPQESL